jgi:hypothetical protein
MSMRTDFVLDYLAVCHVSNAITQRALCSYLAAVLIRTVSAATGCALGAEESSGF